MSLVTGKGAVIAVFGSDKPHTLGLATALGEEIGRRNLVLLTGGEKGLKVAGAVKECAIQGAINSNAPWIGVGRGDNPMPSVITDNSIVIYPGLGHNRNYFEACICDAAVVLEGGDGTVSEATFSLALQKPVLFVGNDWSENYSLNGSVRANSIDKLVKKTFKRMNQDDPILEDLMNREQLIQKLTNSLPPYDYYLPAILTHTQNASQIIDKIKYLLSKEGNLPGKFPNHPEYAALKTEFDDWLLRIRNRN